MAYDLVFRRAALADLEEMEAYLRPRSERGAENVLRDVHDALELVREFPQIAPPLPDRDARLKLTRRYGYRIVYSIEGDRIVVRQIIHPSRGEPKDVS